MRRKWMVTAVAVVTASVAAGPASGASDNAACVGQFSSYFAQGGGGTHRSDLAKEFAKDARPAGQNVYSQIAQLHGSLADCFEQT